LTTFAADTFKFVVNKKTLKDVLDDKNLIFYKKQRGFFKFMRMKA